VRWNGRWDEEDSGDEVKKRSLVLGDLQVTWGRHRAFVAKSLRSNREDQILIEMGYTLDGTSCRQLEGRNSSLILQRVSDRTV
jgi:hypothetical protein